MKLFRRIVKGILLRGETSDPSDNLNGSVWHNSTDNKLKTYVQSAVRELVTNDQTQTITNKTVGDDLVIQGTTESTDKDTGALVVEGGVGVEKNLNVGGNITVTGDLTVNGATTTVNTAVLDVEDTNITVNKGGNDASSEGAGLTVERTGTDGSLVYEDALASKWKLGALGSEVEVVDVSSVQTLTNKVIDGSSTGTNTVSVQSVNSEYDPTGDTYITTTDVDGALGELDVAVAGVASDLTSKADVDLGNLAGPTAVNQDLLSDATGTRDLGSAANSWAEVHARDILVKDSSDVINGSLRADTTAPSGAPLAVSLQAEQDTDILGIFTKSISSASGSGYIVIDTGNNTGTGASGDILITTGTTDSGNSGSITLEAGNSTSGLRGDVITKATAVQVRSGSFKRTPGASSTNGVEERYIDSVSLPTSSTTVVYEFDPVVHDGLIIDYKIKQATTGRVRTGQIYVAATATDISTSDTSTETADVEVVVSSGFGTYGEIRMQNTSATNASTVRLDVKLIRA